MGINDAPGSNNPGSTNSPGLNSREVPSYDPNSNYFDLPGLMDIQSNYLVDLSQNYYNKAIDVAINVNNLQKNLIDVSNSYSSADQSSTSILTDQSKVMNIINDEQKRLNQKQQLVAQMEQENKRKVLLNDTYRKKKVQYSKIMIVIIIAMVVFIVIAFIGKFTAIPEGFLSLLYIVDIAFALIICFNLYSDATMRDYINYDEIYIPPPPVDSSGTLISSGNVPSLWSSMKFGCYESACCADGTVFDDKLKVCVLPSVKKTSPSSPAVLYGPSPGKTPGSSWPGSSGPSSSGPSSSGPSSSGPGSSGPGSSGPGSSGPGSSGPGSSGPGSSGPGSSGPGSLGSGYSGPALSVTELLGAGSSAPSPAPAPAKAPAPAPAPVKAPAPGPAGSAFTTIDQAIQFGDLNENYKIIAESNIPKVKYTLKGEVKPQTALEFTEYKYKI